LEAPSYPNDVIKGLVERKLPWSMVKRMMSAPKDRDRFEKYVKVLQERIPWKEKIVLPIHEHLFVVCKNGELIVKAACGHEFGDYRENWKLKCLIRVRETNEDFKEVYPDFFEFDTEFIELREFYCPGCGELLDVENAPKGYPITFEFLPDVEGFYKEWLGKPVPCEKKEESRTEDRSVNILRKWAEEAEEKGS